MWQVFKNIGFFVVVIIITAGLYWGVYMDKESKQDTLNYALQLLGNDLMAKIPDSPQKAPVVQMFDDILKKTRNREIEQEQVEYLAANLLNIQNVDTTFTPEQVEAILRISLNSPLKIERPAEVTTECNEKSTRPERVVIVEKIADPSSLPDWEQLGERIRQMYDFNEKIRSQFDHQDELREKIYFRVERDLLLSIDLNLKDRLIDKKFKQLAEEMKLLEKEHAILWEENIQCEIEQEQQALKLELEELKQLQEMKHLQNLQQLEVLKNLEVLKTLDALKYLPVIDSDSINKIVKESLKDAGVDVKE